ncbi:hypothetical protein SUGI_0586470 [Cryptomeria japonica]|uniref:arabinogalactan protein 41 n=1 Tax=Cryptomeria japonica TaxID=3369 RepID=UPI002414A432|nr:arabinogalactan protein 41 [Cryptomeria japonica]GLJ29720.1 hypothetical protein SUGI_0586470 [Cryptomeria japonica]
MASSTAFTKVLVLFALVLIVLVPLASAVAPAPAPESDGTAIDQGIAYVLMFVALLLTYLIHPMDAFPFSLF